MTDIACLTRARCVMLCTGRKTSQTALKGVDELQHADDKRSHVNMETVSPTAYIFRLEIVVLYVILYSRERIIRMKQQ